MITKRKQCKMSRVGRQQSMKYEEDKQMKQEQKKRVFKRGHAIVY